jgi:outer membrane receptor protein involved in Fe transport
VPNVTRVCHPLVPAIRRALAVVLSAVFLTAVLPAAVAAQAVTGTLLGNVRDDSGAAVPGVTVTATEVNTNISRSVVSNETGYYIFSNLKDGNYRVEAGLQGFKKFAREGVKVDVNTTVRVDVSLSVGGLDETVTVAAETPALQTDRADTGRVIESKQVTEMPLAFSRNFQGILVTVPGTTRPFRPHSQFFNSQDSLSTQVNGQSRLANNVQIEGLDDNHRTGLLTVLIPPPDALETVSVSTSNYDAEFGRSGGAVTNVTLKSGTNDLKGSVYYYGNTEATNASEYFSHLKPDTKFSQFGFTVGGPIIRNKFFFFGDYQRTVDNLGYVVRATVPTMRMRNGDFGESSTRIYDPMTGAVDGSGRVPFAGNRIPADRISPVAQNILNLMPEPNIADAAFGQVNYQKPQVREKTTPGFDTKLNYTINESNTVSYRFSYQRPKVFDPGPYGEYGGPANDGFAGTGTNDTYSSAANWTRIFSPTFIMDVRGGLSYYHNVAIAQGAGLNTSTDVGIPGANLDEFTSGLSRVRVDGYTVPIIGFSPSLPWDRSEKTWDVAATLTKLIRNHTVKFGGEWRHNRDFLLQVQDAGGSRGEFRFNASGTGSPAEQASTTSIANSFASFLLDWPNVVQRDLKVTDPGTKHRATFLFVQDKWQLNPNVTVDLGLRWEYYTPLVGLESRGGLSNYDPDTNTLNVAGYGSTPADLGVKSRFNHFAPRTGISWRLDDKTVVRAGYGASTIPFPDNRFAFNFPVKQNNSGSATNGFQNAGAMVQGFPAPVFVDIPSDGIIPATGTLLNATYDYIPTGLHEATLHSWNVAFQRELPWDFTGEIAYIGNRGVDLVMDVDLNASMVAGSGNAGRPQFAEFNRTGTTRTRTNDGKSEYNALQVKVDRRFRNGILITNSYTLGRGYDYVSENNGIRTPMDYSKSWARSDFDRLHNYVLSAIYELPWGPGKKWMNEGLAGRILGDWQISGLFQAQSGTPLNINGNGTLFNTPGNSAFPDRNGDDRVLGGLGPGKQYFDPSVYSLPPAGTQGNMSRNGGPDGPGFWELDMSLFKRFSVGGNRFAEIRVDAFNVTNSVRWDNPKVDYDISAGSTFGQITSTNPNAPQRSFRFGGRFVF